MLEYSPLHELKRREAALKIINSKVKEDRSNLYDLTGLSGGFPVKQEDINLLETYAGPAIFEEKLQPLGVKHLGGEKVLALNRTSSGILATILALVKPGRKVVHFLPQLPTHPSIPRSVDLVNGNYIEFTDTDEFKVTEKTDLVIITGSTMDHKVITEEDFLKIIEVSGNVPVLVDDASGARLRTIVYKQPRAIDMGAELVITSTDKLMDGPRGGLMSGEAELIDLIKTKSHQFGLEAQPPLIAGMVGALENFKPDRILESRFKKQEVYQALLEDFSVEETPTGVMILPENVIKELKGKGMDTLNEDVAATVLAMILLREYSIITIPAVGMPGASPTIRIDMASKDAERLEVEYITQAFKGSFARLEEVAGDEETCKTILFG
ncbi:MAG TPA: TIGR03576 family pyridoxal phosphate-dependent enzyme [Methanobacterium sp.]|jgi:L-seryl-tRNA(Ser) seleniumtransferase|nr:MAG: TIGR03576 family pyridoxal phosphate-dependent enzyme [Methanobacterium sp.]HOI70850.1 TIGR03576 family pyridoxal phosphate-dependent enzyme [Methanobacterium sp.]